MPPLLRRLLTNRIAAIGIVIVLTMLLLSLLGPTVAPHDPLQQFGQPLATPSRQFPLGTDNLGRDLLSRLLHGARPSLGVALFATTTIVLLGTIIGVLSGYIGGMVDTLVMRLVDVLLAFPGLILTLAIVGMLGTGLRNVIIGVVLVSWAGYARVVRAAVLEVRNGLYVEAAVASGATTRRVIYRHILPNIISPVIVLATLEMGILMLTIAGLNFLGLGIQPPTPEWGAMLNQGRPFFQLAPRLMIYPGALISLTVLGFNLLGDGLRDALDPYRS